MAEIYEYQHVEGDDAIDEASKDGWRVVAAERGQVEAWDDTYGTSSSIEWIALMERRVQTEERDEADTRVIELEKLVEELRDDDPCYYDHHGYCQAHSLDPAPCPHERAAKLAKIP